MYGNHGTLLMSWVSRGTIKTLLIKYNFKENSCFKRLKNEVLHIAVRLALFYWDLQSPPCFRANCVVACLGNWWAVSVEIIANVLFVFFSISGAENSAQHRIWVVDKKLVWGQLFAPSAQSMKANWKLIRDVARLKNFKWDNPKS